MAAVSTFENNCRAHRIDFWKPLPRLWRGLSRKGNPCVPFPGSATRCTSSSHPWSDSKGANGSFYSSTNYESCPTCGRKRSHRDFQPPETGRDQKNILSICPLAIRPRTRPRHDRGGTWRDLFSNNPFEKGLLANQVYHKNALLLLE